MDDIVRRSDVVEWLLKRTEMYDEFGHFVSKEKVRKNLEKQISEIPPAQPDRDIPIRPIEVTDRAWSVIGKQAACPTCDYYLGTVAFIGATYKDKRVTYCEMCGQAIDWEKWEFDEGWEFDDE